MFIVLVTLSVYHNPRALEQLKRQPSTATASFWVAPSVSVHHRISVLQSLGAQGAVDGDLGLWIVVDRVFFNIVKESVQSSAGHFHVKLATLLEKCRNRFQPLKIEFRPGVKKTSACRDDSAGVFFSCKGSGLVISLHFSGGWSQRRNLCFWPGDRGLMKFMMVMTK